MAILGAGSALSTRSASFLASPGALPLVDFDPDRKVGFGDNGVDQYSGLFDFYGHQHVLDQSLF